MSDKVKVFNAEDMSSDNLSKEHLVLVDFWAAWCGPCRMLAPIVEELAGEMTEVTFAKLNIDDNMESAIGLGISSVPTLMLFKDGTLVERVVGVQPKNELKALIERHIG